MRNYSQNDEQAFILNYFGDLKGRFLDIGAYNGPDISNTWALLESGWRGVMVEPNPFNLVELIKNVEPYADRCEILVGAVLLGSMRRLHLDTAPGRGWAATVHKDQGLLQESPVKVFVQNVDLMLWWPGPYQMISIDAEGEDFSILGLLDHYGLMRACKLVVVEAQKRELTMDFLLTLGFKIGHETPENIIAVR